MVNSFIVIFLIVLSGYLFSCFYKQRESLESYIGDFLYYFALPLTIFLKIIDFDIKNIDLYIFVINSIPILFIYLFVYLLYKLNLINSSFSRTVMISSTLGNIVYMGFAVIQYNFGEQSLPYAAVSVGVQNLVIFSVGVFFINLICFEKSCVIIGIKKAFLNPIFLSTLLGFIFNVLNITLVNFLYDFLNQISKTTIPLALFVIGVSIFGKKLNKTYIKKVILISFLKLIILPFTSLIIIFLYHRFDVISLVSFNLHTMPVAVAAFVVAKDFELEKEIIAGSIIFTTVLYFIFYWIYIMIINKFFYV